MRRQRLPRGLCDLALKCENAVDLKILGTLNQESWARVSYQLAIPPEVVNKLRMPSAEVLFKARETLGRERT